MQQQHVQQMQPHLANQQIMQQVQLQQQQPYTAEISVTAEQCMTLYCMTLYSELRWSGPSARSG